MVIDHGRILEYGTHQELLALRGRYFDLYLTQFADQPVLNGNGNGVEKRPLSKPVLV